MRTRYFVVLLLAGMSWSASAQNLKPGLWELTFAMQGGSAMAQALAEMQKQLASMPPEQRKMLEDSLVRQGINPGSIGTGGAGARVCMTREMVERNELPSDRGDCSIRQQERSGNTMKVAFVCTSPPSSGQGEVTILNPESYAMKMSVTTTARGQNDSMSMQGKGKWLAADCGTVQPLGAKK